MRFGPIVVVASCAATLVLCVLFSGSLIDDAFIFFRYADNVMAGHGAVFNPGERVEGFTSPLWLVLLTVGRALGVRYEASVLVLGTAFALGAVVSTWFLARTALSPAAAVLPTVLMALHPALSMWAVHGLETSLFLMLVTAGAAVSYLPGAGSAWASGLILGLAVWTRPEAGLFAAVLMGATALRREPLRAAKMAAAVAAVAAPLAMARLAYYGALAPNTFYAKTGGGLGRLVFGVGYAKRFAVSHLPLVAACVGAVWLVATGRRSRAGAPDVVADSLVLGGLWSVYVVWVGGDGFPGYRFWLPILPFAGVVAAWALEQLAERRVWRPWAVPATGIALSVIVAAAAAPAAIREHQTGREFTAKMSAVGRWLGEHVPPGTTLAVNYVGAVPYYSELPTIDMLGLTDPEIARTPIRGRFRFPGHAKGNGASVLERRPDLILMGGVYLEPEPMAELNPELTTEDEIAADSVFAELYALVQVRIASPDGQRWFAFYKRRDLDWEPMP